MALQAGRTGNEEAPRHLRRERDTDLVQPVLVGGPVKLGRTIVESRARNEILVQACGLKPAELVIQVGGDAAEGSPASDVTRQAQSESLETRKADVADRSHRPEVGVLSAISASVQRAARAQPFVRK